MQSLELSQISERCSSVYSSTLLDIYDSSSFGCRPSPHPPKKYRVTRINEQSAKQYHIALALTFCLKLRKILHGLIRSSQKSCFSMLQQSFCRPGTLNSSLQILEHKRSDQKILQQETALTTLFLTYRAIYQILMGKAFHQIKVYDKGKVHNMQQSHKCLCEPTRKRIQKIMVDSDLEPLKSQSMHYCRQHSKKMQNNSINSSKIQKHLQFKSYRSHHRQPSTQIALQTPLPALSSEKQLVSHNSHDGFDTNQIVQCQLAKQDRNDCSVDEYSKDKCYIKDDHQYLSQLQWYSERIKMRGRDVDRQVINKTTPHTKFKKEDKKFRPDARKSTAECQKKFTDCQRYDLKEIKQLVTQMFQKETENRKRKRHPHFGNPQNDKWINHQIQNNCIENLIIIDQVSTDYQNHCRQSKRLPHKPIKYSLRTRQNSDGRKSAMACYQTPNLKPVNSSTEYTRTIRKIPSAPLYKSANKFVDITNMNHLRFQLQSPNTYSNSKISRINRNNNNKQTGTSRQSCRKYYEEQNILLPSQMSARSTVRKGPNRIYTSNSKTIDDELSCLDCDYCEQIRKMTEYRVRREQNSISMSDARQ